MTPLPLRVCELLTSDESAEGVVSPEREVHDARIEALTFLTQASVQSPDRCNVPNQRMRATDRAANSSPRKSTSVSRSQ